MSNLTVLLADYWGRCDIATLAECWHCRRPDHRLCLFRNCLELWQQAVKASASTCQNSTAQPLPCTRPAAKT